MVPKQTGKSRVGQSGRANSSFCHCTGGNVMTAQPWKIKGEFVVSCSCAVFCPCVISLGEAPPTHGTCQGWIAIHVNEGYYGKARLDGLNAAWMVDVPGRMPEGNWGFALYIDERATPEQADALTKINMGEAGGPTAVLKQLIG